MNATTRKATPAQNKLPVRNHTTSAMMPAGRMNRRIFAIRMIMMIPTMSSRKSSNRSYSGRLCAILDYLYRDFALLWVTNYF
jgi:hypothetical protein